MSDDLEVYVGADGTVEFVHDDRLAAAFGGEALGIRRASHVEPTVDGRWTADMAPVGGPVLGPFDTRAEALGVERSWLSDALTRGPLQLPRQRSAYCE